MNKRLLLLSTIALTIVVLVAGMLTTQTSFAQAGGAVSSAVAVCDVVEVFNEYQRAKDMSVEFQERRAEINKESQALAENIELKSKELGGFKEGSPEYEAQVEEFQRMVIEAEIWAQTEESLAQRNRLRLTTAMYDEVLAMIKVVAEEQGYDVVFFRESRDTRAKNMEQMLLQMQNRKVLFSSDDVDITGRVLSRLNMAYAAGG